MKKYCILIIFILVDLNLEVRGMFWIKIPLPFILDLWEKTLTKILLYL